MMARSAGSLTASRETWISEVPGMGATWSFCLRKLMRSAGLSESVNQWVLRMGDWPRPTALRRVCSLRRVATGVLIRRWRSAWMSAGEVKRIRTRTGTGPLKRPRRRGCFEGRGCALAGGAGAGFEGDQAFADGVAGEFGDAEELELVHQLSAVGFDGLDADFEDAGD